MFHSIIIAGFPASWWWVYTPTELGVFGGFGDFGCFDCFGGFHDLLPMLRHCTPSARGFRCSKHGFHSGRPQTPGETAHNTQTPCLEEMQHDKSWRRHLKTRQTAKPISMVFGQISPPLNCRGFFGLLFSYPFGLFIPRVLDT